MIGFAALGAIERMERGGKGGDDTTGGDDGPDSDSDDGSSSGSSDMEMDPDAQFAQYQVRTPSHLMTSTNHRVHVLLCLFFSFSLSVFVCARTQT